MKLLTRQEFLELDRPLVYSRVDLSRGLDWGDLELKTENCGDNDWWYIRLKDFDMVDGPAFMAEVAMEVLQNGCTAHFDGEAPSRDAQQNLEERYLVWTFEDVTRLIRCLHCATLEGANAHVRQQRK